MVVTMIMATLVFDLSKLAHLQGPKRSFVGVGGLEVRVRQSLALTLMCHLMIAHLKAHFIRYNTKFLPVYNDFPLWGTAPYPLFSASSE